jgi:hypothetical protein
MDGKPCFLQFNSRIMKPYIEMPSACQHHDEPADNYIDFTLEILIYNKAVPVNIAVSNYLRIDDKHSIGFIFNIHLGRACLKRCVKSGKNTYEHQDFRFYLPA